jgi:hypothetical protein
MPPITHPANKEIAVVELPEDALTASTRRR